MLARGFARDFREPPDQILEQGADRDIADAVGMQVDLRETVEHLPKNAAPAKALHSVNRNLSRKMSRTLPENLAMQSIRLSSNWFGSYAFKLSKVHVPRVINFDVLSGGSEQDQVPGDAIHIVGQPPLRGHPAWTLREGSRDGTAR